MSNSIIDWAKPIEAYYCGKLFPAKYIMKLNGDHRYQHLIVYNVYGQDTLALVDETGYRDYNLYAKNLNDESIEKEKL